MTVLILSLCILASGFAGNIYKRLVKSSEGVAASLTMPALWFFMLAALFGVLSYATGETPDLGAIPIALLGGVCMAAASSILIESMKQVSLSISIIIMNLNFIIPVLLSAVFLHIPAKPLQLAGMLLSISVIVLLNAGSGAAGEAGKPRKTAILLPLVACIANGLVNFCITVNGNLGSPPMFFFAVVYGSGALACLICGCVTHKVRGGEGFFPIKRAALRSALPFVALLGVCNGVCFYTERLLADGRMNPAALFTTVTCASVALSLLVGFLFQGDKLTKKSAVSILFCVLAILCQHSGIS